MPIRSSSLIFFFCLISCAWLVPNHYPPWVSAWSDALAIAALLLLSINALILTDADCHVSWQLPTMAALCFAVLLAQLTSGLLLFAGDALMAASYVSLWLSSVLIGRLLTSRAENIDVLNTLAATWLFAALISVGIALAQWTGALNLGIYTVDLPPGARPFGNVAQPNHLSTVCFLGLCGLLCLQQHLRVKGGAFWLAAGFLLWGIVMSQSRTGWLQVGVLVVWGLIMHRRAGLKIMRAQLLSLGVLFIFGVLVWPVVCDAMLLTNSRTLDDQMQAGNRLPYWHAMFDAILREPLRGYGWLQVGAAQQRVAIYHPIINEYFDYSHNLILDLLLWNGIPFGGVIVALLLWWFIAHIRTCCDGRAAWLLAALFGVMVHAMLEYPLAYAYFLIPVGLTMGAVEVFAPATGPVLCVSRWTLLAFTLGLAGMFVAIASEYLQAEENYRIQRMELAHIGTDRIVTPAPHLPLLTQLDARLQAAHIDPAAGMQQEQVDGLRRVTTRYGFLPMLSRYALALALNGNMPEAVRQLQIGQRVWGQKAYDAAKLQFDELFARKCPNCA